MDPLLAAQRLPRLAERVMRSAIAGALSSGRVTPRAIVHRALVDFETAVARLGTVRPALLFVERDRIARELRTFVDSRLAVRLRALRQGAIVAAGAPRPPLISSCAIDAGSSMRWCFAGYRVTDAAW